MWSLLTFSVTTNFLLNYLSLQTSRMIVRLMSRRSNDSLRIVLLLLLDTALTTLLAALSVYISLIANEALGSDARWNFNQAFHNANFDFVRFTWLPFAPYDLRVMSILFFSAYFTALWVWLYLFSGLLIKYIRNILVSWGEVSLNFDIDRKPLSVVGKVAGLTAGTLYAVILGAIWLGKHIPS
jgi:hypothetical protein